MNDQPARYARLRHTATGALAALAAVGAIAGATALAANQHARPRHRGKVADGTPTTSTPTKTPASPGPSKTEGSQPAASPQPFLNAVQQLVDNGTITAAQGQAVDAQIQRGYFDSSTLTGFSQSQIQAVEQALTTTKMAMEPSGPVGGGKSPTSQPDAKHRHRS